MLHVDEAKAARIAKLNDLLRSTWGALGYYGEIRFTEGFRGLPHGLRSKFAEAIETYKDFSDTENDPYGEHDFGTITIDGVKVFFKIDYFDKSPGVEPYSYLSPDASNRTVTQRVLTAMLAEEY